MRKDNRFNRDHPRKIGAENLREGFVPVPMLYWNEKTREAAVVAAPELDDLLPWDRSALLQAWSEELWKLSERCDQYGLQSIAKKKTGAGVEKVKSARDSKIVPLRPKKECDQ